MARDYVVLLDNRIRFATASPVPVDVAIESLRGMDSIIRVHFPRAIKKLTGAQVKSAELLVKSVEDGSLITDTVVKLVFGSKKAFDKYVGSIRDRFVVKNENGEAHVKGWVAGSLLIGVAIAGVGWYQAAGKSTPAPGMVSVQGDSNVIITIGADAYNTDPDAFAKAIEESVSARHRMSAARAGMQMLAPSTDQGGAAVELLSGSNSVQIVSAATAAKVPRSAETIDTSEDVSFAKAKIKFRASDSDSDQRGWAATLDGVVEKRTRVVFQNSADVGKVIHKPDAIVDATVTYSDSTHTKPILIIVEKVY